MLARFVFDSRRRRVLAAILIACRRRDLDTANICINSVSERAFSGVWAILLVVQLPPKEVF